jgi:hypothetical protein
MKASILLSSVGIFGMYLKLGRRKADAGALNSGEAVCVTLVVAGGWDSAIFGVFDDDALLGATDEFETMTL